MDTLDQGSGKLFTDPSSIAARADFQQKSRAMTDKVTTVSDAVGRLLGDIPSRIRLPFRCRR